MSRHVPLFGDMCKGVEGAGDAADDGTADDADSGILPLTTTPLAILPLAGVRGVPAPDSAGGRRGVAEDGVRGGAAGAGASVIPSMDSQPVCGLMVSTLLISSGLKCRIVHSTGISSLRCG